MAWAERRSPLPRERPCPCRDRKKGAGWTGFALRTERADQLQAAHDRHLIVGDDQVGVMLAHGCERLCAMGSLVDRSVREK
jgi:hypothetical protein